MKNQLVQKDPFALRRAAIGLLRIIIENKLSGELRDLIDYSIKIYLNKGLIIKNKRTELEILRIIFKRKNEKYFTGNLKILELILLRLSISSHNG